MLGDTLGEIFQQIPPALIINVCASALLLTIALVYFAVIKPRRRKARTRAESAVASAAAVSSDRTAASPSAPVYEMPDLDMLVDDSTLEDDLPAGDTPLAPAVTPEVTPAATQPPAPPVANGRVRLDTGETITAEEVVSVRRDSRDGRLVVVIDGVGYRSLVDAPDVKSRFVTVMKQLNRVVTQPDDRSTDTEPSAETSAEPESAPPEVQAAPAPPQTEKPKPSLTTPPPPDKDGNIPGALPSYNMDEAVKPVRGGRFGLGPAKYQYAEIPELDIAGAIEAYLQHRIAYTPEFQGRNIHVHAAPGGVGVRIQVGDKFYDMVDEVEEADARDFISAVIEEWQSRQ